jgi:hypothetical protein
MARAPDREALATLNDALARILAISGEGAPRAVLRRVREGLAQHAEAVERARGSTDPVALPTRVFDPSDPKTVGLMVSIALLAQPRVPLGSVKPTYGSGVYAIYFEGAHPLYDRISGTETPIYVGKADPSDGDASTPREQGPRLTGRLIEHAGTIATAEQYAAELGLSAGLYPIRLADFTCRRLVCATNAQLVAERHLIRMFWPVWNADTKACWGMSKHGDAAKTRRNKRSPWDVVHPGRAWALDAQLEDKLSVAEIEQRIASVLDKYPPPADHASLVEEMLLSFQQTDMTLDGMPPPLEDALGQADDEAGGLDDD